MTQTLEPTTVPSEVPADSATGGWDDPTAPPVGPQPTPRERVGAWLSGFEAALAARDPRRAASHFAAQSFWRDLMAFTWNPQDRRGSGRRRRPAHRRARRCRPARSASYDETTKTWSVTVDSDGESVELRPTHLVFATGMSGKPNVPTLPGQDVFRGEQQHSSQHPGPEAYAGKKVVVIGSNNSAFDICGALWEHDADVTMVQRSSTHIVKSASLMDIGLGDLYFEGAVANGVTTDKADMIFASLPYRIIHEFQIPLYQQMAERDADFYARMERAGFELDWDADESGLFMKYLRRGSGDYIDVGAAELVADGQVKLAHGQVSRLTEDAVVLADGTELPADLVVYATGYGSMNGWIADIADVETADKLGKCWGLGSDTPKDPGPWEGEQRNMWKPTQQENLWMHGGNLHQSRHYSLYLALQLKARYEGIPTPVYGLQQVRHIR
jgi:putative flavoprotein involved in K+ transport